MAERDPRVPSRRNSPGYDEDFAAWAETQAALLREGRFEELDIEHLADEVESVGKSEFRALKSAIALIVLHMMKWDYQPEKRSRSWRVTIHGQRRAVTELLKENPSFKARLDEAIEGAWIGVPGEIERETTIPVERLPETCPYDWDAIMTRLHEFDPDRPWPN